jgi:hypothetical protein
MIPNYGPLFGEIFSSVPQMSRDESYRDKMNSISRQLGSLVNEVFYRFPTAIDDAGRQSAWNQLVDKSRELMLYYLDLYKKNPNAPLPTRDTMLVELGIKVSDPGLKSAINSLRGVGAGTTFQGPALATPRSLENVPAREEAAPAQAAPARRNTVPTIADLRSGGYANIVDMDIGGKIFRFAAKDPGLDLEGSSAEDLMAYAAANPGQMRMFEVNARGYATRELRASSERDMGRIRAQITAQNEGA